jgi:hypothetical protein
MAERAIGQAAGGPPDPPRPPGRPSANMPNSRRTSIPRRPWHTFANGPQPGGTMNSRSPERRRPSANVPSSRRTMTSSFSAIDYMSAAQYRELIVRRLIHEIMPPLADHVTPERRATIRGFVREYVERRIANPENSMYQYLQRRLQAHAENQARPSQPVLAHWNLPPNLDGAADSGAQGVQATRNVRGLSGSMHSPGASASRRNDLVRRQRQLERQGENFEPDEPPPLPDLPFIRRPAEGRNPSGLRTGAILSAEDLRGVPEELFEIGERAAPAVRNVLSSLPQEPQHPRSWTDGRPLRDSMPGSDDHDIRQDSSIRAATSVVFREPWLGNGPGQWPADPGEGPSSWTNGRPLDSSAPDGTDTMYTQLNRGPTSFVVPINGRTFSNGQLSLESGDSSGIWTIARPLLDFDDNVPSGTGISSEAEDIARQSRGPLTDGPSFRKISIRGRLGLRKTKHFQSSERVNLLTSFISRGEGEVTKMGGGESYRPAGARPRSPPRIDSFRGDRDRSPRRERARTPQTDSWHPSSRDRSPRRRSRTPPRRDRSPLRDNWRARPRSPMRARTPPRRFSPRRDDDRRPRSPARRDER